MIALLLLLLVQTADLTPELETSRELVAAGNLPAAAVHLQRLTEAFPTWGLAQLELAEVLLKESSDSPTLASAVSAVQRLEPFNPRVWLLVGRFHERQGEGAAALDAYARAVALRPELIEGRERLGLLLLEAQRPTEALPHLVASVEARPGDRALCASLAQAYEGSGDLRSAERELRALVAASPRSSVYRRRLASFYQRTKKSHQATPSPPPAGEHDPGHPVRKMRPLLPSSR